MRITVPVVLLAVSLAGACDGAGEGSCGGRIPPGGLVLTEIHAAPSPGGLAAEWVELRNVLPWSLTADGLRLVSGTMDATLRCDGSLPAGGVFVVVESPDAADGGGIAAARCVAEGLSLPDTPQPLPDDLGIAARTNRLRLVTADDVVIDDVPYLVPGAGFPAVTPGASLELCAEVLSAAANDPGGAWRTATAAVGLTGGERGTPGIIGLACGLGGAGEGAP